MKYYGILIAIIFGVGLALGFIAAYSPDSDAQDENTQPYVAMLKARADSLEKANEQLDRQLLELSLRADSMESKLAKLQKRTNHLKQKKHETLSDISDLHAHSLLRFFANITSKDSD